LNQWTHNPLVEGSSPSEPAVGLSDSCISFNLGELLSPIMRCMHLRR